MTPEEKIDEILYLTRVTEWRRKEPRYFSRYNLLESGEHAKWRQSKPIREDIQKPGNPIWKLVDEGLNGGNEGHERWYLEQIGKVLGIEFEEEGNAP